jgi:GMP synthase (glutamine-hydrolysing)
VVKWPGGWKVGRMVYDFGGREVALNAWHQDQVAAPPPGAETVATGPDCPHAALAIGPATWTIQAHPEFGADLIAGLIRHRGGKVPAALIAEAEAQLDRPTDRARIGAAMARHLARAA